MAFFNFTFVLSLFDLELLLELIDFLFLGVQDFVFLFVSRGVSLLHVLLDFLDVLLVSVDDLLHVHLVFFKLL